MIENSPESLKLKLKLSSFTPIEPSSTKSVLTKQIYDQGFVDRYFIYRITNNTIYEVQKENYDQVNDVIFKKVQLKWKLSGPANSVYDNKVLMMPGVIQYNTKQIKTASETVPQILDYLNDPLQYYLGY